MISDSPLVASRQTPIISGGFFSRFLSKSNKNPRKPAVSPALPPPSSPSSEEKRRSVSYKPTRNVYEDPAFSSDPHTHPYFVTTHSLLFRQSKLTTDDSPQKASAAASASTADLAKPAQPLKHRSLPYSSNVPDTVPKAKLAVSTVNVTKPLATSYSESITPDHNNSYSRVPVSSLTFSSSQTIPSNMFNTSQETQIQPDITPHNNVLLSSGDIARTATASTMPPSTQLVDAGLHRQQHLPYNEISRTPARPMPSRYASALETSSTNFGGLELPPRPATATIDTSRTVPMSRTLGNRRVVGLDKIDELDESNPLGVPLHHESPYESVRRHVQKSQNQHIDKSGAQNVRSLTNNVLGYVPQHRSFNGSLNLSPGQILPRDFQQYGPSHAMTGLYSGPFSHSNPRDVGNGQAIVHVKQNPHHGPIIPHHIQPNSGDSVQRLVADSDSDDPGLHIGMAMLGVSDQDTDAEAQDPYENRPYNGSNYRVIDKPLTRDDSNSHSDGVEKDLAPASIPSAFQGAAISSVSLSGDMHNGMIFPKSQNVGSQIGSVGARALEPHASANSPPINGSPNVMQFHSPASAPQLPSIAVPPVYMNRPAGQLLTQTEHYANSAADYRAGAANASVYNRPAQDGRSVHPSNSSISGSSNMTRAPGKPQPQHIPRKLVMPAPLQQPNGQPSNTMIPIRSPPEFRLAPHPSGIPSQVSYAPYASGPDQGKVHPRAQDIPIASSRRLRKRPSVTGAVPSISTSNEATIPSMFSPSPIHMTRMSEDPPVVARSAKISRKVLSKKRPNA